MEPTTSPVQPVPDFAQEALPHLDFVTRVARSLTRSEMDADDLVQETFLRACRSWGSFQPGTSCRAWLFTICRNAYLSSRERESRSEAVPDADLESLAAAALHALAAAAGYADVFERFDLRDAIRHEVEALSPALREAIILVDMEDWSYEEAARALKVPIGTVRSRLFRGRRVLQERLLAHARDLGLQDHTKSLGKEAE